MRSIHEGKQAVNRRLLSTQMLDFLGKDFKLAIKNMFKETMSKALKGGTK